ncbi:MAG: hypothetical protein O2919_10310, partial [Chloroflexi bacterium]|nr:hypothetical protein [Chloroflexota bacterium]
MPRRVAFALAAVAMILIACSPEGPEPTATPTLAPTSTPTPAVWPPPFEITVTELPESVFHPGDLAWGRNFPAAGPPQTPLNALDAEGGVVVAHSDGDFTAEGDWGIVLARYHADGSLDWGRRYSHPTLQQVGGLAIRGDTIYIAGRFDQVANFGLGPLQAG